MKFQLVSAILSLIIFRLQAQEVPRKLLQDDVTTVIVFLGLDCPISQKYIPTLNALASAYSGKDVRVRAVVPGKVRKKELQRFIEEYRPVFPVSIDRSYKEAGVLNATVTPEVFVLDDRSTVRYRGAIDNWFYELGGYRKEASENYLADAVDAVLAGSEPAVKRTKALGCFIEVPQGLK